MMLAVVFWFVGTFYFEITIDSQEAAKIVQKGPLYDSPMSWMVTSYVTIVQYKIQKICVGIKYVYSSLILSCV